MLIKFLIKYLSKWGYDVKNNKGNSNLFLNLVDFILLLGYIIITVYLTCSSGIANLTYIATSVLSLRILIKFWIKQKQFKNKISITYNTAIIIYTFFTAILIIIYFCCFHFWKDVAGLSDKVSGLFLILYYVLYFIFETTEIMVKCFDAEPCLYSR